MNESEIRHYNKIPKRERPKWSKPFKVGDEVEVLGTKMRIKKIKPVGGILILEVLNQY